jgi:polysaccharide transporter, PST family
MKDILAKLREGLLDRRLARNIASLYGVQFANYLLPLITIPYLTRVLGPATWGLVAFAQAFGGLAAVGIGYGFDLSATREAAKNRDSPAELANLLAGVMGAKLLLAAGVVALAFLIEPWVPLFHRHPIFLWAAVFWAVAQAFSMLWYYQGVERMRLIAALDVMGRTAATAGIFIIVRHPGDGWKVLGLQGAGMLLSVVAATAFVYREIPLKRPTWRLVRNALRMGWSMFVNCGAVSLYGMGNSFLLGLFVSPQAVGFYAGAEKITHALMRLLVPIHQSLYPRLSHLAHHDRPVANRLAGLSLLLMSSMGAVMSLAAFFGAPWAVQIILGKNFAASVPVLRIMAPLPFLDAVSTMLGVLWMLPLRMDRQFNKVVLAAGALNIGLAVALAPRFAQLGMASAVVIVEAFVAVTLYVTLHRKGLNPLSARQDTPGKIAP